VGIENAHNVDKQTEDLIDPIEHTPEQFQVVCGLSGLAGEVADPPVVANIPNHARHVCSSFAATQAIQASC
jgi:hypothetical protein